ncbi:hypothetical protein DFH09DRAFT_51367 [Mycena vulgaris]|nr:hypothetical protein DFH09DRAFT_51367 [Mycena vulgaris]
MASQELSSDATPAPNRESALFCGSETDSVDELHARFDSEFPTDAIPAPTPHFLPFEPSPAAPAPPSRISATKTTGCGARLHSNARAHESQMWCAPAAGASKEVISLDRMYFSPGALLLLDIYVEACGCERGGVGCQICGNVLGALLTPCALHEDGASADSRYIFISSAVSPSLPIVTDTEIQRPAAALADLRSIAAPVVVDLASPPQPEPVAPAAIYGAEYVISEPDSSESDADLTPSRRRRQLAGPSSQRRAAAARPLTSASLPHSLLALPDARRVALSGLPQPSLANWLLPSFTNVLRVPLAAPFRIAVPRHPAFALEHLPDI